MGMSLISKDRRQEEGATHVAPAIFLRTVVKCIPFFRNIYQIMISEKIYRNDFSSSFDSRFLFPLNILLNYLFPHAICKTKYSIDHWVHMEKHGVAKCYVNDYVWN